MKLIDAENLAKELMQDHGLIVLGWTFIWLKSSRVFGLCSYNPKTISLSLELVRLNEVPRVKDTILHEIAHAIAGYKAGHGKDWKKVCVEIGCRPVACFNSEIAITSSTKFIAVCNSCERNYINHIQKPIYCGCQNYNDKKEFLNWESRSIKSHSA